MRGMFHLSIIEGPSFDTPLRLRSAATQDERSGSKSVSLNPSSSWSPTDYAANAAFVPALGGPALALLDPQPGEMILDIGCGDGILPQRIMASGARVIGLDASPEMVEAA